MTNLTSGLTLLPLVLEVTKVLALLDPINEETLGETEEILLISKDGDDARGIVEFNETEFVNKDVDNIPECSNEFCKFFISVKEKKNISVKRLLFQFYPK